MQHNTTTTHGIWLRRLHAAAASCGGFMRWRWLHAAEGPAAPADLCASFSSFSTFLDHLDQRSIKPNFLKASLRGGEPLRAGSRLNDENRVE